MGILSNQRTIINEIATMDTFLFNSFCAFLGVYSCDRHDHRLSSPLTVFTSVTLSVVLPVVMLISISYQAIRTVVSK